MIGGTEPVELLALVEHDLHRADPGDQQDEADEIDRAALGRRFREAQHPPGRMATAATGTLMKKTHGQPTLSTIAPPSSGPAMGATTVVIDQRPIA